MKFNRTYLFIALSSIALLAVLVIQVNWIVRTAKVKEELYKEKANMVIARTVETLAANKNEFNSLKSGRRKIEVKKIDSLLKHYMKFYGFWFKYNFIPKKYPLKENAKKFPVSYPPKAPECFNGNLDEAVNSGGYEMIVSLPKTREFILSEVTALFITSIFIMAVVVYLFWRTVRSLTKEKQLSQQTNDFLNNMTHEFKTPLTNIALAGKMMTKESTLSQQEKIRHYSFIILQENEKLRLQVEQLLSLTALEKGEIPLNNTKVDFHGIIGEALRSMSLQLESVQGNVQLESNASNSIITGDKSHLTNVLCNLIDNTIKYSEKHLQLFITTRNLNNDLVIEFSDNGIGIERQHQNKVFQKYFRVPTGNVHDVKGFGLGLAYVKKIIELHGGTIELLSTPGEGTTFTITFPNA